MNWKLLTSIDGLDKIDAESADKPVAIFKHSNSCPVSAYAKHSLEQKWDLDDDEVSIYHLDLLAHRDVSNEIARRFGVRHQSPQVLLIREGRSVYNSSHSAISVRGIRSALARPVGDMPDPEQIQSVSNPPRKHVRITHRSSGLKLADGPLGWGITTFEGNFYISSKYLQTDRLKPNFIPGVCLYKFLYVWLDLHLESGEKVSNLGWKYWLPNPLLPFIWYRVALPASRPELLVEQYEAG